MSRRAARMRGPTAICGVTSTVAPHVAIIGPRMRATGRLMRATGLLNLSWATCHRSWRRRRPSASPARCRSVSVARMSRRAANARTDGDMRGYGSGRPACRHHRSAHARDRSAHAGYGTAKSFLGSQRYALAHAPPLSIARSLSFSSVARMSQRTAQTRGPTVICGVTAAVAPHVAIIGPRACARPVGSCGLRGC
jgi:hypothetical protein